MPKVFGTRRHKAMDLLKRLEEGPSFSNNYDGTPFTAAQASEQYKRWSQSWILHDLKKLVPELKEKK